MVPICFSEGCSPDVSEVVFQAYSTVHVFGPKEHVHLQVSLSLGELGGPAYICMPLCQNCFTAQH